VIGARRRTGPGDNPYGLARRNHPRRVKRAHPADPDPDLVKLSATTKEKHS